jgi:hypothetical protein
MCDSGYLAVVADKPSYLRARREVHRDYTFTLALMERTNKNDRFNVVRSRDPILYEACNDRSVESPPLRLKLREGPARTLDPTEF